MGVTLSGGCKGRDWAEDQPIPADRILPLAGLGLLELYPEADSHKGKSSKISDMRDSSPACE